MSIGHVEPGLASRLPPEGIGAIAEQLGASGLRVHGPIPESDPRPDDEIRSLVAFVNDDLGPRGSKLNRVGPHFLGSSGC